jgi:DNA-binding response OmpR family regulator
VALPGIAERLARYLLERPGEVVSRSELAAAAWSSAERVRSNLLDVHIARLRRKAEPLGLTIHTIRRHGYLLEIHDADGRSPWERLDT